MLDVSAYDTAGHLTAHAVSGQDDNGGLAGSYAYTHDELGRCKTSVTRGASTSDVSERYDHDEVNDTSVVDGTPRDVAHANEYSAAGCAALDAMMPSRPRRPAARTGERRGPTFLELGLARVRTGARG